MIENTINKCPICDSKANYIFTSKREKEILHCSSSLCEHFFTPMIKSDQGICLRPDDLEKESNESLEMFNDRNLKLLSLFKKHLKNKSTIDENITINGIAKAYKELL